jgi:hypothetical protein
VITSYALRTLGGRYIAMDVTDSDFQASRHNINVKSEGRTPLEKKAP